MANLKTLDAICFPDAGYLSNMRSSFKEYHKEKKSHAIQEPTLKQRSSPLPARLKEYYIKENETICNVKKRIPFDLFIGRKEIIRQSPHDPYNMEDFKVTQKEGERLGKGLVVMLPPAVALDGIEDPKTKDIVLEDMYLSTTEKANRDAALSNSSLHAWRPDNYWTTNTVKLPKSKPPVVPKEWRWESVKWDRQQSRVCVDTHKEFWKRVHNLDKCPPCKQSTKIEKLKRSGHL